MYVMAAVNRKGGAGKTSTAYSLGHALARFQGRRVLLVDTDSQGSLSDWCDVPTDAPTLADVALGRCNPGEILHPVAEGVDIAPGGEALQVAVQHLSAVEAVPQTWLKRTLRCMLEASRYDVAILDASPSMDILAMGCLVASDGLVLCAEPAALSFRGLSEMQVRIAQARRDLQPALEVLAVVLTRYDARQVADRQALEMLTEGAADGAIVTTIARTVRMVEAPGRRSSILDHAPDCQAAHDYAALAKQLDHHIGR